MTAVPVEDVIGLLCLAAVVALFLWLLSQREE